MHLMIDFETLDVTPSAVVVSLGAALFKKEGVIDSFYRVLKIDEQLKMGRTLSEGTLQWWFQQSKEAQAPLHTPPNEKVYLQSCIGDLMSFCEKALNDDNNNWKGLNVWGNGANFDPPILDDMFRMCGLEIPYMFWNVRCYRTFDSMTKCKELVVRQGTHHNAEDDAIYQAETVIAYLNRKKK